MINSKRDLQKLIKLLIFITERSYNLSTYSYLNFFSACYACASEKVNDNGYDIKKEFEWQKIFAEII